MFGFMGAKTRLVTAEQARPGRETEVLPEGFRHRLNGRSLRPPFPAGMETGVFGMGCFWGAERLFWGLDGVWVTAVGYAGGFTPNPTYEEVCSGRTGHAEVVRVVYDPALLPYHELLRRFWEEHDPTQGMRQGNDVGTQYRSLIGATTGSQLDQAQRSRDSYGDRLAAAGRAPITTEIIEQPVVYLAEDYHQQYLHANPHGYCGLRGTGISCLVGSGVAAEPAS